MRGSLLRYIGLFSVVAFGASGCNEIQGRRKVQQGNKLYRDGMYKEAVATFDEAEKLVPDFWVLWLNKGYTCRQMIVPGSKTPENLAAAKCAMGAFKRLQELKPDDARGELLYIQTLFDADEYEALSKMYTERYQKNPREIDNINGLIQVFTKWNKLEDALEWYTKKAEVQANDAEAQYGVGVFLWQQLMSKGGGPDKASFDPRPDPNKPKLVKTPPPFAYGDIVSQQRVDLADKGVEYLNKALALRPKYPEAMTYVNLLYRQRSFALFDQPEEWQKSIDEALKWMCKSLEAQAKQAPPQCKAGVKAGAIPDPNKEEEEEPAAAPEPEAPKKKAAVKKKPARKKRGRR